jgi:transcriptional regulator with XRE-family HTH domain
METTINQRVKILREHLNLSQEEFAVKVGTTNASISRIEKGLTEPRKSTINKMMSTFNVNEWLINGKGSLEIVEKTANSTLVWKDEAYASLKEEVKYLREMLRLAVGGKSANFLKALEVAEIPNYLLKGVYSGASAQPKRATA